MKKKNSKFKDIKLIGLELEIEWIDRCELSGWKELKAILYGPCRRLSYGKCIKQTDNSIILDTGTEKNISYCCGQTNTTIEIPISDIQCIKNRDRPNSIIIM